MTKVKEPTEQAQRLRKAILQLVMEEHDQTGDAQSVFHGVALAFGSVLSAIHPNARSAAKWMEREAQRMHMKEPQGDIQ